MERKDDHVSSQWGRAFTVSDRDSNFPLQDKHDLDDLAKVAAFYVEATERKGFTDQ
jgi:hypothetical protein